MRSHYLLMLKKGIKTQKDIAIVFVYHWGKLRKNQVVIHRVIRPIPTDKQVIPTLGKKEQGK